MKKILALTLAMLMLLALCACGSSSAPAASAPAASDSDVAPAAAEADAAPAAAEADATGEKAVLVMATHATFPPYEFVEGSGFAGIDVEIAGAIAEKLGMELQIEDMEFGSIIESVKSGKADIGMAGMTVTEERKEVVDFTESYATGKQVIIVADGSEITSVDDLFAGGYTVGVQVNTTGDLYTTWDLEDAGLATIDRYSKGAEAVQALASGKVDCVVTDNEPAKAYVAEIGGMHILETEYIEEMYAACMSKDNTELYEAVNNALKELIADGTVQAIIDKYISAE